MYDLRDLRDNLDQIKGRLGTRSRDVQWDTLRKLLEERRGLTVQVEHLRADLKKGSDEVASLKRQKLPSEAAVAAMKQLGERIAEVESALRIIEEQLDEIAKRYEQTERQEAEEKRKELWDPSETRDVGRGL